MCQMLSGLITKNKTYYNLDKDNHEDLIKEAGLKDTSQSPDFVRVEIIPIDGNIFNHDPKNWQLKIDQDFKPEWFSEKFAESEMRKALQELFDKRFVINKEIQEIKEGRWFIGSGGTVQRVWGGGTVQEVLGGTVQEVLGGTVQEVLGGGTVQKVWGGGTVQRVWGGGTVQAVLDGGTVQNVLDGGTVQEVLGGTVQEVLDGGTVQVLTDNYTIKEIKNSGIVILRNKEKIILTADKSIKLKLWKANKK